MQTTELRGGCIGEKVTARLNVAEANCLIASPRSRGLGTRAMHCERLFLTATFTRARSEYD